MVGKHAWAEHTTSSQASSDHIVENRDWLIRLSDPVLYIVAALLCAILAIDAFVLLHTM